MEFRRATNKEIADNYAGRKASYKHGTVEGMRFTNGKVITTQRSNSTSMIYADQSGVYAMRKGKREDLKANLYTLPNGTTFVASLRATYLA